jgi:hypothetical protein
MQMMTHGMLGQARAFRVSRCLQRGAASPASLHPILTQVALGCVADAQYMLHSWASFSFAADDLVSAFGAVLCRGVDNDLFAPQPLSSIAATSAVQCFTQYAQMSDAWWLPTTGNTSMSILPGITSFSACVDACTNESTCQYLTYDYNADTCYVRTTQTNGMAG